MTLPMLLAAAAVIAAPAPHPSWAPRAGGALVLAAEPSSIGVATMEPDGTIVLQLRTASPEAIGEALLRYPPGDPHYKAVRDHLPNLRPGGSVPVPPFD